MTHKVGIREIGIYKQGPSIIIYTAVWWLSISNVNTYLQADFANNQHYNMNKSLSNEYEQYVSVINPNLNRWFPQIIKLFL